MESKRIISPCNVRPLLYLPFVQHKLSINEGSIWVREKLQRSRNKLCPAARELMYEKYQVRSKCWGNAIGVRHFFAFISTAPREGS